MIVEIFIQLLLMLTVSYTLGVVEDQITTKVSAVTDILKMLKHHRLFKI